MVYQAWGSASNAGAVTNALDSIPLTVKGHKQALELSERIQLKPELIIVTPYLRTQQTARPTIQKFPEVLLEVWPLHEFDYLSSDQCVGTNLEQRKPMAQDSGAAVNLTMSREMVQNLFLHLRIEFLMPSTDFNKLRILS